MEVIVHDRAFRPFISSEAIAARISEMGAAITEDYQGLNPLCLVILNGAFMFAADLFRAIRTPAEICFVRLSSYAGMASTGQVATAFTGSDTRGRHVLVLEDIIDTGTTLQHLLPALRQQQPASVKTAALLVKNGTAKHSIQADYTGFEIPDRFVVGYGMDYNGLGRNLPGIYQLV